MKPVEQREKINDKVIVKLGLESERII